MSKVPPRNDSRCASVNAFDAMKSAMLPAELLLPEAVIGVTPVAATLVRAALKSSQVLIAVASTPAFSTTSWFTAMPATVYSTGSA